MKKGNARSGQREPKKRLGGRQRAVDKSHVRESAKSGDRVKEKIGGVENIEKRDNVAEKRGDTKWRGQTKSILGQTKKNEGGPRKICPQRWVEKVLREGTGGGTS